MSLIDDYLNRFSDPQKAEIERIRKIICTAVPEAEEVISYGIPGFKYKDKYLVGFNAFKDHYSIFPTSHPIEILSRDLVEYKTSKGTIQYTANNLIPESLVKKLLAVRLANIS